MKKLFSILALSLIATAALSNAAKADVSIHIGIGNGGPVFPGPVFPGPVFRPIYLGPQVLGSTRLSYRSDRDEVMVRSCENGIAVDALKIKVQKNDARIDYIVVTMGNGQRMELNVRDRFREGSESRWIPLNGQRCIRSFEIYGETDGLPTRQTKVKLIGNAFRTR